MKTLDQKIKDTKVALDKTRQELDALLVEKKKLEAMPQDYALAIFLHDLLCTWNHTDGCGWFYEFIDKEHNWSGHTHGRYLGQARKVIHECKKRNIQVEAAIEFYNIIRDSGN
jgi:uncharacterized Fe-S cluster-containing MiaB family protein